MTIDWQTGQPYPQPSDQEYQDRAVIGPPPLPLVDDYEKADLPTLIKEVKNQRLYASHLYMAYKELVNIKGDMATTLQSMISLRDHMMKAIEPLTTDVQDIKESLGLQEGQQ